MKDKVIGFRPKHMNQQNAKQKAVVIMVKSVDSQWHL